MPSDLAPATTPRAILLVDDDEGVREALSGQLEMEGYAVTVAEDGRAAHRRVQAEPRGAGTDDGLRRDGMVVLVGRALQPVGREVYPQQVTA